MSLLKRAGEFIMIGCATGVILTAAESRPGLTLALLLGGLFGYVLYKGSEVLRGRAASTY